MTANAILQLLFYVVVLILLAKPLGLYMTHIYEGTSVVNRIFGPAERLFYRRLGVREDDEMTWKVYTAAFLLFNLFGLLVVYLLQRVQTLLPLNQGTQYLTTPMMPSSAFNTAVSFATNTNWQGYGGE